jgi:hypothetical protein
MGPPATLPHQPKTPTGACWRGASRTYVRCFARRMARSRGSSGSGRYGRPLRTFGRSVGVRSIVHHSFQSGASGSRSYQWPATHRHRRIHASLPIIPHHPSTSHGGSRSLARAPQVPDRNGRSECHGGTIGADGMFADKVSLCVHRVGAAGRPRAGRGSTLCRVT